MLAKIIHFIKYNNLVVLIAAAVFLLSTGVFAQTEAGQAVIGARETAIEGTDNNLLIEADLAKLAMDFTIEEITEDSDYYYITYTYIDLVKANNVWQYQMREKQRKITRNLKIDLGVYLAEELGEECEARLKELKEEQERAQAQGGEQRVEVTSYSGLIGQTLELAGRVFPGYESVKIRTVPSPSTPPTVLFARETDGAAATDDLTDIYQEYMDKNDPDRDDVFGILDNCPSVFNPDQEDSDNDGVGDACPPTEEDIPANIDNSEDTTATSGENMAENIETGPASATDASTAENEPADTDQTTDTENVEAIDDESSYSDQPTNSDDESSYIPQDEATEDEPEVEIIELPME